MKGIEKSIAAKKREVRPLILTWFGFIACWEQYSALQVRGLTAGLHAGGGHAHGACDQGEAGALSWTAHCLTPVQCLKLHCILIAACSQAKGAQLCQHHAAVTRFKWESQACTAHL